MLFSTAYLPPISYYRSIINDPNDDIYLEAKENYQKRSYRNRTYLLTANGVDHISVPLAAGKNKQHPITSVLISYDTDWIKLHLDTIQTAYSQSAFFVHYFGDIKRILEQKHTYLFDLNLSLIQYFISKIGIQKNLVLTDDYQSFEQKNLSDQQQLSILRPKQDLEDLQQSYYPQVYEYKYGFTKELSILDLLFCMGPESLWILQNK